MTFPSAPAEARAAIAALVGREPRFGAIEAAAGELPWRTRPVGFPGLLQTIVAQQVSNQAAAAIWRRLSALPGALDPVASLGLPDAALIGAGLSRPKVAHARALAHAFADGRLHPPSLHAMDDAAAIATLVAVRGLGPWTAEVYLLFAHQRADVFPAGDVALAASAAELFGLPARPTPLALRAMAHAWQPWRALAARLLWHHWRFVTGRPAMDDIVVGDALPSPAPHGPVTSPAPA